MSLTAPASDSRPAAPITLSATANGTQGYTVSKVEFFHGSTLIGTDSSAPYSVTWSDPQVGNAYTLTAKATAIKKNGPDQTANSSPISITVNARPSVSLAIPEDGARFGAPTNITATAVASDSDGTVASVNIQWWDTKGINSGSTVIPQSPYSVVVPIDPGDAGEDNEITFVAIAIDNDGAGSGLTPQVTIIAGSTVTLATPIGPNYSSPATIPLSALIAPSNSDWRVEFYNGENLIGQSNNPPHSFSWENVGPGSYSLTAKAISLLWESVVTSQPVNVHVSAVSVEPKLHFIHVDHLNTPRLISDSTGTALWRWDQQEPFGVSPADKNPSGLGVFDFPLRHPGQYDDPETGLFYNYFRDCYDPVLGRYCQSDPIGLRGGLNTYAYVDGDPLRFTDPLGLQSGSDVFGERPRPPVGWPNVSQQAQQSLAQQLQQLWNNVFNQANDDLERCMQECEEQRKRDQDDCEWWWKMLGRNAEDYRQCQRAADERLMKCYDNCRKTCK